MLQQCCHSMSEVGRLTKFVPLLLASLLNKALAQPSSHAPLHTFSIHACDNTTLCSTRRVMQPELTDYNQTDIDYQQELHAIDDGQASAADVITEAPVRQKDDPWRTQCKAHCQPPAA